MTTIIDLRSGEPVITTEPPLDCTDGIFRVRYSGHSGGAVETEFGGFPSMDWRSIPEAELVRLGLPTNAHDWTTTVCLGCGRVIAYTGLPEGDFRGFAFGWREGRLVEIDRWSGYTVDFEQLATGYRPQPRRRPCPSRYTFEPDRPQE